MKDVRYNPTIKPVYWMGNVEKCQICQANFKDVMYDSNTRLGWGNICQECFEDYGTGLGTGRGQKYERQADGRWLKMEG